MTEQHPLTDELIDELAAKFMSEPTGEQVVNRDHDMRAAADWQLEQVVDWLRHNLHFTPTDVDYIVGNLQKAMRPTTTQEDN